MKLRGAKYGRPGASEKSERGAVLILAALMITVLLGVAGLAVDLGNWYLQIQRIQRASDAAALAGDPYMPVHYTTPDSTGRSARTVARDTLIRNGIPVADANKAFASTNCATPFCIAQVPGKTTQLRVKVETKVDNYFLKFFGLSDSNKFTRDAIADWAPELHITSNSNVLGAPEPNDGSGLWGKPGGLPSNTNYWLQIGGQDMGKAEGDRFSARRCTSSNHDNCNSTYNNDHDSGYIYLIDTFRSSRISNGWLEIQAFDATHTRGYPGVCSWDPNAVGCPNDENYSTAYGKGYYASVSFELFATHPNRGGSPIAWCNTFHPRWSTAPRWEPACTRIPVDFTKESRYFLRVRTGDGDGINHFMLRAGVFSGQGSGNFMHEVSYESVQLSAETNMGIYNQIDSWAGMGVDNATFIIGNVGTEWAGRTIHFEFWDVGDASGGGWLYLGGSSYVRSQLSGNCVYTEPGWGWYNHSNFSHAGFAGCGFAVTNAQFNGKLVRLEWHVPASYVCNSNCLLTVEMDMNGDVYDDTVTTVREPGKPLRIVD